MKTKSFFKKSLFLIFFVFTISSYFPGIALAVSPIRTIDGTVTKVTDGETIQVTTQERTKIKVRLYGIAAPKMPKANPPAGYVRVSNEFFGMECKKELEAKLMGNKIQLDVMNIDKYKRSVGILWLGDRNINLEMIREGYAKAYESSFKEPYRAEFLAAQKEARSFRRGLWNLPE